MIRVMPDINRSDSTLSVSICSTNFLDWLKFFYVINLRSKADGIKVIMKQKKKKKKEKDSASDPRDPIDVKQIQAWYWI